jgi:hypothetical protein
VSAAQEVFAVFGPTSACSSMDFRAIRRWRNWSRRIYSPVKIIFCIFCQY